ncbi:class F sortase [Saccharopolyspora phatthalungensis]|uniref:class F sortase n=1 Tax=Saccharopolyspora phatthalungensis TaxID=664693 RepID=UPI0035E4528E
MSIPAIRVTSTLVPLGLTPDGSVEVPPIEKPKQAGWFQPGPGAGEVGPFVVLGHVDSYTEAGVFYRLRDLRIGDRINVGRRDGSRVTYLVDRIDRVAKNRFPTDAVYGNVTRPEIRLITCGGDFDESRRSYEDNVIVFGHLA